MPRARGMLHAASRLPRASVRSGLGRLASPRVHGAETARRSCKNSAPLPSSASPIPRAPSCRRIAPGEFLARAHQRASGA